MRTDPFSSVVVIMMVDGPSGRAVGADEVVEVVEDVEVDELDEDDGALLVLLVVELAVIDDVWLD